MENVADSTSDTIMAIWPSVAHQWVLGHLATYLWIMFYVSSSVETCLVWCCRNWRVSGWLMEMVPSLTSLSLGFGTVTCLPGRSALSVRYGWNFVEFIHLALPNRHSNASSLNSKIQINFEGFVWAGSWHLCKNLSRGIMTATGG